MDPSFHTLHLDRTAPEHHGIWSPGVRLFQQLRFRAKALVITLVFLAPLLLLGWVNASNSNERLALAQRERAGLHTLQALMPFYNAALQANAALKAQRGGQDIAGAAQLYEQQRALMQRSLAAAQADDGLQLGADGADLARQLNALGTLSLTQNNAHPDALDALISDTRKRIAAIGDASGLVLDPEIASAYLVDANVLAMPRLLADAAYLWGIGAYSVAKGALDEPAMYKRFAIASARSSGAIDDVVVSVGKSLAAEPQQPEALKVALLQGAAKFVATSDSSDYVKAADEPVDVFQRGQAAFQALTQFHSAGLSALDTLLSQREASTRRNRDLRTGFVVFCLAVAAYCFISFARNMTSGLGRVAQELRTLADGDLTAPMPRVGRDETSELTGGLQELQQSLRQIVQEVRKLSQQVQLASSTIAQGANDLSQRTETAASAIGETASAMDRMTQTFGQSADSTQQAARFAQSNASVAARGEQVIEQSVKTMDEISVASGRIGEIISVIDGIAFQTNILALNAAVEAARAGDQGRGFAVVATEVRTLAQRSATAAREIKALIVNSMERTEQGVAVVKQAGGTMTAIVENTQKVRGLLDEIAESATHQTDGMDKVNRAVAELEQATQQNAALVEETAAATSLLAQDAEQLNQAVARFRL